MGLFGDIGDAVDGGISVVGGAVVDAVKADAHAVGEVVDTGVDVASDVVRYEVDAAGNVVDAAGHVLQSQVNAAGEIVDAAGGIVGSVRDFATSPFGPLGPIGPPLWGLSELADGGSAKAGQVARLGSGQPNADVILDLASDCVRLFQVWRPRMVAAGQHPPTTLEQAAALFDRERGMSFATLREDQRRLLDTAALLSDAAQQQQQQTRSLAATWQGDGGTAAQAYLAGLASSSGTVTGAVVDAAVRLGACATDLEKAVSQKAQSLLPLHQESIGGKSPADVDLLIVASRLDGDSWVETAGDVLGFIFPGPLALFTDSMFEEVKLQIAKFARDWLEGVFFPTYNQAAESFVQICAATTDSIRAIYGVAATGFDGLDPAIFAPLGKGVPGPQPPEVAPPAPAKQPPVPSPPTGDGPHPGGGQDLGGGGGSSAGPVSVPTMPQGAGPVLTGGPLVPDPGKAVPPSRLPITVPAGLPPGAGWVSDPKDLPTGWTIDSRTGQLRPPDVPGSGGHPEVHSAVQRELLEDNGKGHLGSAASSAVTEASGVGQTTTPLGVAEVGPARDGVTGSVVTVVDHGVSMQISAADAAGAGVHIQVTDASGGVSGYRVEIGADGHPQLVPDSAAPSAAGAVSSPSTAVEGAGTRHGATAGATSALEARSGPESGGPASAGTPPVSSPSSHPAELPGGRSPVPTDIDPAPAQVHSAAVGGSWFEPTGPHHEPSGASLASAQGPSGAGAHHPSGATLASSGGHGTAATGSSPATGSTTTAGMGGVGAPEVGEGQEHRPSQRWWVLDDTLVDEARTWASLGDVLGRGAQWDEKEADR